MLGKLTAAEIDHVLRRQHIGRLGVASEDRVYIFPVSYGYDGEFIYVVSQDGLKVKLMQRRSEVCFEVEAIDSPTVWRTVLVHGSYEELHYDENRERALSLIAEQARSTPLSLAPYTGRPESMHVYRIRVKEATGRFERDDVILGEATPSGTTGDLVGSG